ncbi:MAG: GNAT family N-acetyltransferase [Alloprevotella sp.]|nr:GNAT family N-acetyltransferase [Alloprevotella sp.]
MITLRPLEPEDLDILYTIENAPESWSIGLPGTLYSRFSLRKYILSQTSSLTEQGQLRQVIDLDGRAIGLIDLFDYDAIAQRAEVGIAVLKTERHNGYATEALRLLILQARQTLNLHQLTAKITPYSNPSCNQVFEHNGFCLIATLPDWSFQSGHFVDIALYSLIL